MDIWSKLLKTSEIGIDDGFFDLGGHSILAAQMVWAIKRAFTVDVPIGVIFQEPTIAALAVYVENAMLASLTDERLSQLMARSGTEN